MTGASGTDVSQGSPTNVTGLTTSAASAVIQFIGSSASFVGNIIKITGGTNFTVGWYEIISVSVGTSFTVDRNCTSAAGAAGTGNIGGPLASPGQAAVVAAVSGQKIWVKSGTYTLTTSTPGAAGPVVMTSTVAIVMQGYNATRGDTGSPPVISAGNITSVTIVTSAGGYDGTLINQQQIANITADGNSKSGVSGFNCAGGYTDFFYLCNALNCPVSGFYNRVKAIGCYASACAVGFSASQAFSSMFYCVASACTTAGFDNTSVGYCTWEGCIAKACQVGFKMAYPVVVFNSVAYASVSHGFSHPTWGHVTYFNCIAYLNGGYGWDNGTGGFSSVFVKCAGKSNTSGNVHTAALAFSDIALLTADPFTNAAGGDFSLNTTAGGGAALRAAGYPGVFPGGLSTGYLDIGAVQHPDPGGGGGGGGGNLLGDGTLVVG